MIFTKETSQRWLIFYKAKKKRFFFFINRKNIVIHLNIEALLLVSTFHLNLEMVPLSTQNLMFLFILKKVF